jgi:hypothetical protein
MARAIRVVDNAGVVHNVIILKIAYQGVVRRVGKVFVSQGGIVRQVWPPA